MCRFSPPGGALIVGLVAVIGLTTPALCVRAQATAVGERAAPAAHGPSAEYERTITQALREFELEHYPEARSAFLHAHTLYPNARTYRALGMVEFELRNYPTSIEYLAQALASRERPLEAQARAQAEELIGQARSYVARYTLRVQPAHAALRLGGSALTLDADKSVVLQVGDYVLEAEATGYVSERRDLHVVGNEDRTLELRLVPRAELGQAQAADATSTREPHERTEPLRKKWWLWTSVGLVVVAAVTTGLVVGLRQDPEQPSSGTTGILFNVPSGGER